MQPQNILRSLATAVVFNFGVFAGSAQTTQYLYTGSLTFVTLNPGTYNIVAYGAQGGSYGGFDYFRNIYYFVSGGLGAGMGGEFTFFAPATLTLLVGGSGGSSPLGCGGGGGSFVVNGTTPLVVAGGGGGATGAGAGSHTLSPMNGGDGLVSNGGNGGAGGNGGLTGGGGGGYRGNGGNAFYGGGGG